MVRPLPMPPDGNISNRRLAQIRRRHREKILKIAQRQKKRQESADQKNVDKLSSMNKTEKIIEQSETIELDLEVEAETETKEDNPNSPRRILRDIQRQRKAKRKKSIPIDNAEFYPDKLKRKVLHKKIKLTPNQDLIPLGWVNKRKRNYPKKGEEYEQAINKEMPNKTQPKPLRRKVRNAIREETVEEIIMRIEETDSLTDEDLIEILTCPSPVWWEEPLNPFYFDEEPINKKLQKPNRKQQNQASIKQNKTVNQIDKLKISLENRDAKFVAKRNSLEHILSNIKHNIEPDKNAQNFSKKPFIKKPWKYIDERNPAFGLKRNSKGRFLKKIKFGSSPITISDASDKEDCLNNSKITPKIINLDKSTTNTAAVTKIPDAKTINIDIATPNKAVKTKISENTAKTVNPSLSDILPENIINDSVKLTNSKHESAIDTIKNYAKQKEELNNSKTDKEFESPKALIWTSNTGESKVITFTQDSEMSSDGVEIVAESVDINIPTEMPPLKWYPKTKNTEESEEIINITSEASSELLCDDKNEYSYVNDSCNISSSEEQAEKCYEGDSNMDLIEDIDMSQSDNENEISVDNNMACDEINKTRNDDDKNCKIDSYIDIVPENNTLSTEINNTADKNDANYINDSYIDTVPENNKFTTEINNTADKNDANYINDSYIDTVPENNKLTTEINNTADKNDANYINDSYIDTVPENNKFTTEINNTADKNDANYINDDNINDISSEIVLDITNSDQTETNVTADDRDKRTPEPTQRNLIGVLERAMGYFRKKSKDVPLVKDKNDDYVVVYKIDEAYNDDNIHDDDDSEEFKENDDFNEFLEEEEVSGSLDDFYTNVENGH